MSKIVALIGMNVGDVRVEAGDTLKNLDPKTEKYLLDNDYAIEADKLTDEMKQSLAQGVSTAHPVVERLDSKEVG